MTTVRLYPGFVTAAARKGIAAPLALWTLARAVDDGTGRVQPDALRAAALELWSAGKYRAALRAAVDMGLIRHGRHYLYLAGLFNAARALGLSDLGRAMVEADSAVLRCAGSFRAALWAAFHAGRKGNPGRPISRRTLEALTGTSRRTQTRHEQRWNSTGHGRISRRVNFAVLCQDARQLTGYRENVHGACYLYGGAVVRPLPNSYTTDCRAIHGNVRKVSRRLRALVNSDAGDRAPTVFYDDAARLRSDARRHAMQSHRRQTRAAVAPLIRSGVSYTGAGVWRFA